MGREYLPTIWVFPKIGVGPQNGWWIWWKTLLKWMIWGLPLFLETPIYHKHQLNVAKDTIVPWIQIGQWRDALMMLDDCIDNQKHPWLPTFRWKKHLQLMGYLIKPSNLCGTMVGVLVIKLKEDPFPNSQNCQELYTSGKFGLHYNKQQTPCINSYQNIHFCIYACVSCIS